MPRIADNLQDGIAFLYRTADEARARVRLGGTAFLISKPIARSKELTGQNQYVPYLVTNRHVAWLGGACVASVNRRDGGAPDIWDLLQTDWKVHPVGDDVAVACVWGLLNNAIHRLSHIRTTDFITPETIAEYHLGMGDEVFMLGRFVNHQGRVINKPSARFGTLSMMQEQIWQNGMERFQESFAVEMRSRTGFSGSPVSLYRTRATILTDVPKGKEEFFGLLGVNWGFIYDDDGENSWLNGVVPAWKILETLEVPDLVAAHKKVEDGFYKFVERTGGGTLAGAFEPQSPKADENPRHKEDFTSLLDAATRGNKPTDRT